MKECCNTCKNKYMLEKLDYSQGGCKHSHPEGFICMAFAYEGVANWMIGDDPDEGHCEVYTRKEADHED